MLLQTTDMVISTYTRINNHTHPDQSKRLGGFKFNGLLLVLLLLWLLETRPALIHALIHHTRYQ